MNIVIGTDGKIYKLVKDINSHNSCCNCCFGMVFRNGSKSCAEVIEKTFKFKRKESSLMSCIDLARKFFNYKDDKFVWFHYEIAKDNVFLNNWKKIIKED